MKGNEIWELDPRFLIEFGTEDISDFGQIIAISPELTPWFQGGIVGESPF